MTAGASLAERYRAGDRVEVWVELARLGELDGASRAAALEVARATMERVRDSIAAIARELSRRGYVFARPARAWVSPGRDASRLVDAIEVQVGAVPVALRALWEVVGSYDVTGSHPDWPAPACLRLPGAKEGPSGVWLTDPLVLYPVAEVLERVDDDGLPTAGLPLWPDAFHKAGYSGGPETCAVVPAETADAELVGGAAGVPASLVGYLRWALGEYGGFPGFAGVGADAWPGVSALRDLVVAP